MPDIEISRLTELPAGLLEGDDVLVIVDDSASETKKIKATSLVSAGIDELPDGTIDPDRIDWDSAGAIINGSSLIDRSVDAIKLVADSLTAAEIAPNAIGASELADGAVDTAALVNSAVTADKIAANTIDTSKIVNGSITTDKLADGAVTYAKTNIDDGSIPGDKIQANSLTANQIAADAIGSSELADNAVDTAAIADLAITTAKIANDAVTNIKIAPNAVETEGLADGAVTFVKTNFADNSIPGAKIVDDSVTAAQIAPNAINASELADNAVDSAALAPSAVTTAKINDGAVATAKLADDAVTQSKIGPLAVGSNEIALGGVNTDQLANNAVTPEKLQADLPASILATGSITSGYLADEAVTTAKIDDLSVTTDKINSSAVTDAKIANVDGSKLIPDSVEASKFSPTAFDGGIELDGTVRHVNDIVAATASGISWDEHGHIIGSVDLDADDMPIATATQLGAISVPAGSGLTVSDTGEIDHLTLIDAGLMSGISYDEHGHITSTRALISTDLPLATSTTIGAVSVPTNNSNPLTVNGDGDLTHSESVITPGTYASLDIDQYGHAIAGSAILTPDQVPPLDASKITTGEFNTAFLADKSVTRIKLADYSISFIQEAQPSVDLVSLHIGCLWFQPSTAQLRMYDGNVFAPIGFGRLSQDNLRFCGTIDASTGLITTLNERGQSAGFEVGAPPPEATDALGGAYLLVDTPGDSISVVPGTSFTAGDWCLCLNQAEGWLLIDAVTTGGGGGGTVLLRLGDLLDVDIVQPEDGDALIYNADTNTWRNQGTAVERLNLSPAFDGATTQFTLSNTVADQNNLTVSISGVIQEPGVDFVVTDGTADLRFSSAPPAGSAYFVLSQQATATGAKSGGGGTELPPGTSANELLGWNNTLGAWGPVSFIDGGTY